MLQQATFEVKVGFYIRLLT
uniref:Uncharacterized protein n=1 Tax=Rhizophora mucronata TaxID=61149 RepID=A0A2P2NY38_RHIMU